MNHQQSIGRWVPVAGLAFWLSLAANQMFAQVPQWWVTRGVVNQDLAEDYAPVNQGQLKWLASNAYVEVSQTIGPSADLTARISTFSPTNNFFPVNIGQVKYLATPFYDRLYEFGLTNIMPPGMQGHYPWVGQPETNDFAMVNIGQAKYVFSFDLSKDTDGDGLLDWVETGTGVYISPYNTGTSPNAADTDGDGISDYDELNLTHTDPLNSADGIAMVADSRAKLIMYWNMIYPTPLTFTNTPGSSADLQDMGAALSVLSTNFVQARVN